MAAQSAQWGCFREPRLRENGQPGIHYGRWTRQPMTSFRQIEANRRNAHRSTGPNTEEGKRRSRQNAVRHGLCAETVVEILEDVEDYRAKIMLK